jgi:hypothetical protein
VTLTSIENAAAAKPSNVGRHKSHKAFLCIDPLAVEKKVKVKRSAEVVFLVVSNYLAPQRARKSPLRHLTSSSV